MPRYLFTTAGADSTEEDGEFDSDGLAEEHARGLSRSNGAAVTVHRHSAHVDAWEYLIETDERE
ncbi:MAG: hypothetical protein ACYCUG_02280 [Acidimicrobiales bacterium]